MTTELTEIIKKVTRIRGAKKRLDDQESELWKRVYEIADDIAGPGQSYKFTDPELEKTIGREMHTQSPRIVVEKLQAALTYEQWLLATREERVVDAVKLEKGVATGKIPVEIVQECTEHPNSIPHKKFGSASKADMEKI